MNRVVVFYGSRTEFEKAIPKDNCRNLTELVMDLDTDSRVFIVKLPKDNEAENDSEKEKIEVENFIVGSDEYAGVREHVISNFVNFLAKMKVSNLYLQNPPLSISRQIKKLYPQTEEISQKYKVLEKTDILRIYEVYESIIKGQNKARDKILRTLFPLTSEKRTKPIVMLFYGDTGLGKTETAQIIGDVLNETIFRKQFSMFQNNQSFTYLFGGSHNEGSFAKDLLDRESNVILIDEFDKAYSAFHSAFYQLFDEGIFEDQNYYLELKKSIIICTSNYKSLDDIKAQLGKAIYSRFDSIIEFSQLSTDSKAEIATLMYNKKTFEYATDEQTIIIKRGIKDRLIQNCILCDNAREISHLVDETFSLILFEELINSTSQQTTYSQKRGDVIS